MKNYPLFRLKLVLAGDWHQFNNWLRENPMQEGEDIVFVRDIQSLFGRQKDNVELIKTGGWYKNEAGKEAIKKLYPFFTDELLLEPNNSPVPIQVSARYRPDPIKDKLK